MPQLQLISTDVSYLINTRDTILIRSPMPITKQQKGDIGIHRVYGHLMTRYW